MAGQVIPAPFREPRPFPGQDPWIVPFEDSLLLIQSTAGDRKITVMRFRDLTCMDRNQSTTIWAPPRTSDHAREIWAPELHHLSGRWYVYYTACDGQSRNHRTYVLEADHPLGPYRELGQVCDPDHDVWSIDLTVVRHNGGLFAVWSGWDQAEDGFPQNLYLAPMSNPWTISGPRARISRPEHEWEMSVAAVNEGPQVLRNRRRGKLFIVYSADASWTAAYKMGLLEWVGGDITDPAAWRKLQRPILSGGGHGCFVEVGGSSSVVYHRKTTAEPGWSDREIRSEPLSWDDAGYPVIGRSRPAPTPTQHPRSALNGGPVDAPASTPAA